MGAQSIYNQQWQITEGLTPEADAVLYGNEVAEWLVRKGFRSDATGTIVELLGVPVGGTVIAGDATWTRVR